MTAPFNHVQDSATIGVTEYYLFSDSTVVVAQTTGAWVRGWIDFSAMTAAETYDVKLYEKVNGSGLKLIRTNRLVGAQSELYEFDLSFVKEGYEVSVTKVAGTDRPIGWGLNSNVGDVNVVSIAAAALDSIWDEVYEGSETVRQALRLMRAVLCGKGTTLTGNPTFRDIADSKNRVIHTMSGGGATRTPTTDAT